MITSDEWTPSDVARAQAASTAGNPSVSTAARMATIWRSPSSDPASLRRTRSSAAGNTQSLNGAPFKDWLLPASLERVRRKLKGSDDGDRQMVKVLSAVLTDGLAAVEAACAEALAGGVHSADVVLNILARHRDPGPAATILTPDALRLRHAPIADCARYDRLRRVG